MSRKYFQAVVGLLLLFAFNSSPAQAQSDTTEKKYEVGGHFTALAPEDDSDVLKGFGGRLTYNVTNNFAVEAEANFFPDNDEFSSGNKSQGLFGVKAGKRFSRVGIFGKLRPGFMYFERGDVRFTGGAGCSGPSPVPSSCFEVSGRTDLAVDVGGVLEIYPASRIVVRVDGGDTILRSGRQTTTISGVTFERPAFTSHVFQGSVGIGFRF